MSPLIYFNDVSVSMSGRSILKDLKLKIKAGEIVSVVGPNGGGKTTLARLIVGTLAATGGTIKRAPALQVGYLPQRVTINPALPITVERLITSSWDNKQQKNPAASLAEKTGAKTPAKTNTRAQEVDELLELCGATKLKKESVHRISIGQLQRVLLARALVGSPDLVVLDEPLQGVDAEGQARLYRLLGEYSRKTNTALVLVSHDLHLVMANSDVVLCVNGHICCQGTPSSVADNPSYLELFGKDNSKNLGKYLGVYRHSSHHDHSHKESSGT